MKVLHVFNELKFSGAEIMYVNAAAIFQKAGCGLTAVSTGENLGDYAPMFEKAAFNVLHKPVPRKTKITARLQYYMAFSNFVKREGFEVVHIHRSDLMWGIALAARIAKKKSVYTFHNVFRAKSYTWPYWYCLRVMGKHIFGCRFQTISESVYENELRYFKNKTTKIFNWYNEKRFYPALDAERLSIRKALGISENTCVIISIGGCSNVKRHSDVICALQLLKSKGNQFFYLHLGKGCTEDDEKQLVHELGLAEQVLFCGNQEDVRKYLIASDVYVMPSRFEGISLTTIEAMACRIPCVLYDVPGLRDFNLEGDNAYIIPEIVDTLAESILKVSEEKLLAGRLSASGHAFVNKAFSMEKNALEILALYTGKK